LPASPPAEKEEIMIPVRETPMTELTDMELDAVCGGLLNFNFASPVTQTNVSTQTGVAVGIGGLGALGAVLQASRQTNINL
jgi:hypothetical protein